MKNTIHRTYKFAADYTSGSKEYATAYYDTFSLIMFSELIKNSMC